MSHADLTTLADIVHVVKPSGKNRTNSVSQDVASTQSDGPTVFVNGAHEGRSIESKATWHRWQTIEGKLDMLYRRKGEPE